MLEGAETKNMKAYIQESVGIRKDAELCIFHVGSNDISSKRTESQYNTDLMILFGACRTSFPNARLCCSSVRVSTHFLGRTPRNFETYIFNLIYIFHGQSQK